MRDDAELLRCYVAEGSGEAFAELVQRHLNLVYRAALRQTGNDPHRAEEVSQLVFTLLARKAAVLSRHSSLTGWLHATTRLIVREVRRAEWRRQKREQEAQTMHEFSSNTAAITDWDRVRPVLDEVMQDLNGSDRDAILLRFFQELPFAQIGAKFSLSEDAARMRVERALDKLRSLLARRGFTSTSSALAVLLAAEGEAAVPAGLATSLTGAALVGAATATTIGGTAWTLKFLYLMNAKTTAVMVVATLFAVGAAFYESTDARKIRADLATAASRENDLSAKLADLQQRLTAAEQRAATADQSGAALLKTAQDAANASAEAAIPITSDVVKARLRNARALAQSGQFKEALKEYMWCYDVGTKVVGMGPTRTSYIVTETEQMGRQYPEALAALRARRDQAAQQASSSTGDYDAMADFSSINRALNEDGRTLEFYDQLPADDRRRTSMGILTYKLLADAQRYADAAAARPYGTMSSNFERSVEERPEIAQRPNTEELRQNNHDRVVTTAAQDIEVLAGAGDLAHARSLASRLLTYDNSEETKAMLQKRIERAGHPELLLNGTKP